MITIIQERIERGAKLLDETNPGWFAHIDLAKFHIDDEHKCVLGQIHGNYYTGVKALFGDYDYVVELKAVSHGFLVTDEKFDGVDYIGYAYNGDKNEILYDEAWKTYIAERQALLIAS